MYFIDFYDFLPGLAGRWAGGAGTEL